VVASCSVIVDDTTEHKHAAGQDAGDDVPNELPSVSNFEQTLSGISASASFQKTEGTEW
jgi:hypothetical protein